MPEKRKILRQVAQFGTIMFLSKVLSLLRELLTARYLGVGSFSDAFISSMKLPSMLRRLLAEGSISSVFVPLSVELHSNGKREEAEGFTTLVLLAFTAISTLLSIIVVAYPRAVIKVATPGFSEATVALAEPFVRIMFPGVILVSAASVLSGANQARNSFFSTAFGPLAHNLVVVISLVLAMLMRLPAQVLAVGVLLGNLVSLLVRVDSFVRGGARLGKITKESYLVFTRFIKRFFSALLSVGITEANLFFDNMISSFLGEGAYYSLVFYCGRFISIPIGAFAVAISTVLLPYFSRMARSSRRELEDHLEESLKLIVWVITPVMLWMMLTATRLFSDVMNAGSFSLEGGNLLRIYSLGLILSSFGRVGTGVLYSLGDTKGPALAASASAVVNISIDIIGMRFAGSYGIAAATVLAHIAFCIVLFRRISSKHGIRIHLGKIGSFLRAFSKQMLFLVALYALMWIAFRGLWSLKIFPGGPDAVPAYWMFNVAAFAATMLAMVRTRTKFGVKLGFLDQEG